MATIPEAKAMGFVFPSGADLISKGDDAIQVNALAAATGISDARYARGNHPPADWDTIRTPGAYNFGSPFPDDGSTNFPPDAETALTLVVTTPAGTWGVQEAYQFGPQPRRWWRTARTSVVWNPWIEIGGVSGIGSAMAANAAHQTRFVSDTGGTVDTGGKAAFALRLDHGWTNIKAKLRAELLSRGIVAGVAMNSRTWADAENSGATQSEVNGWVANGEFEILNHGATHAGGLDESSLIDEIVTGRQELEAQLPAAAPIYGFAPPGVTEGWDGFRGGRLEGWTTPSAQIILSSHAYSLGYVGGARRVLDGMIRQGLSHITLDTHDLAQARAQVDAAISERRGIQMMLHPRELDKAGKISTTEFFSLMDYVVAKRDAGDLVTLSPNELVLADSTRPPVAVSDVTGLQARLAAMEPDSSGLRDVTDEMESSAGRVSGRLLIERTGTEIKVIFQDLVVSVSGTQTLLRVNSGWQPWHIEREWWFRPNSSSNENTGTINVSAGGYLIGYNLVANQPMTARMTYDTAQPFPTTFPGDPA